MTDIKDDPFAKVEETEESTTTAKKATTKKATAKAAPEAVEDAVPADDGLESFLAEMTIDDEDFAAPLPFIPNYIRPAEHLWVPVRITSAKVEARDMNVVVAYTDNGDMVTNPGGIDKLVERGKEQSVEQASLYQFVVEAEHVATHFGQRATPYRLYTQVFPVRIPLKQPRRRGGVEELGFDKNSGKKLLAATRVVTPGQKITEDEEVLQQLADAMVADDGKIVMARIKHRVKKSDDAIPRKNADGTFVKALVDESSGSFVYLSKGDGGKFYYSENDAEYEGDASKLIPYGDNRYIIPDSSDDAAMVKDIVKRENTYDNLSEDVAPVPRRMFTIQRTDGSEIEAEVTWETIGFAVVSPVKAGTMVQAVAEGGELITASWLGTHWQETEVPHELQVVRETGEVRLVSSAHAAGEGGGISQAGLDVYKG